MKIDSNGIKRPEYNDVKQYENYNHPEAGYLMEYCHEPIAMQNMMSSFMVAGSQVSIPQNFILNKNYFNRNHIDIAMDVTDTSGFTTNLLVDNKRITYDDKVSEVNFNLSMSAYNTDKDIAFLINNRRVYDTTRGLRDFKDSHFGLYLLSDIRDAKIAQRFFNSIKEEYFMNIPLQKLLQNVTPYHVVFFGYDASNFYSQPLEQFGYKHSTNDACALNRCMDKKISELLALNPKRPKKEKIEATLKFALGLPELFMELCENININTEQCDSIMRMCRLKI